MSYPGPPLNDANTFRVMHLQAGQAEDDIRCQLERVEFSKDQPGPIYEAISYTWGDNTVQQEILCDDSSTSTSSPLRVTTNCHNALQNLRYPDRPRTLWIDAVCIDQTNIEERNAQVKMMGSIFAGALEVVVYLGESADDSDQVMAWYQNNYDVPDYPRENIAVSKFSFEAEIAFAKRTWFTRTWTLQEVANARSVTIVCGPFAVPWDACNLEVGYLPSNKVQAILRVIKRLRMSGNTAPEFILFDILRVTRNCTSSDPRDKIYGTLPLMTPVNTCEPLKPNYHITTQELFVRVAEYLYPVIGATLLSEVAKDSMAGLPSWAPDWSSKHRESDLLYPFRRSGQLPKNAGGIDETLPAALCMVRGRRLHIRGVLIGFLSKVGSTNRKLGPERSVLIEWRSMARQAETSREYTFGLEPTASTPGSQTMSHFREVLTQIVSDHRMQEHFEYFIEYHCGDRQRLDNKFISIYNAIKMYIFHACFKRKFAIVGLHTMAIVPEAAQVSDVVYVFPGAPVPYLLREQGDAYVLIGECYVQGIMDGEAVKGIDLSAMEEIVMI